MSFAQDVKTEITQKKITRPCCLLAASYGAACFSRYFDSRGVVFQTELGTAAHYVKRVFHLCGIEGNVTSKQRPSGTVYEFKVDEPEQVRLMMEKFHCDPEQISLRIDPTLLRCPQCSAAFLAAAFVCCGTMTDPRKEYNLEFLSSRHNLARDLEGILAEHEFRPHRTLRKGVNVVYVKASEQIEELLAFMGAGNAAMEIMNHKVIKELRNKTNRLTNCETANMDKTATANVQVTRAIEYLKQNHMFDGLSQPLREAAELRLAWPDLSLSQLAEKSPQPISKSGLSHRLKKLERLASELQQRRTNG